MPRDVKGPFALGAAPEECAWEFADTEKFVAAGEELCGPYKWGVYDLLVLPPSFPYGGIGYLRGASSPEAFSTVHRGHPKHGPEVRRRGPPM